MKGINCAPNHLVSKFWATHFTGFVYVHVAIYIYSMLTTNTSVDVGHSVIQEIFPIPFHMFDFLGEARLHTNAT